MTFTLNTLIATTLMFVLTFKVNAQFIFNKKFTKYTQPGLEQRANTNGTSTRTTNTNHANTNDQTTPAQTNPLPTDHGNYPVPGYGNPSQRGYHKDHQDSNVNYEEGEHHQDGQYHHGGSCDRNHPGNGYGYQDRSGGNNRSGGCQRG